MSVELGTIVADFSTSLATKLTAAGTSCSLQSATDDDSVALPNGAYSFTVDGDNSQKEHLIATLSGTSLTAIQSVSRQGVLTSGAARTHRIGAKAVITDYSFLGEVHKALSGSDSLTALMSYATELTPTTDYQIVYKKWVEDRNGYWTGAVADYSSLPMGSVEGEARVTLDTGKIYVWDIVTATGGTYSSVTANVITTTAAHGLAVGEYVYWETTDTLPTGLAVLTPYYVLTTPLTTTFTLSATKAGPELTVTTGSAAGTNTYREALWLLAGSGGGAGEVYIDTFLGTDADDAPTNTTFSLTSGAWVSDQYLQVYVNGVLQEVGASEDYTTTDLNTIVLNTAVEDTDKVTMLVVSVDLYNPAWGSVNADIVGDTHNTYDIGATATRFKDLFLEGAADLDGTLNVEGVATFQAEPVFSVGASGVTTLSKTLTTTKKVAEAMTGATLPHPVVIMHDYLQHRKDDTDLNFGRVATNNTKMAVSFTPTQAITSTSIKVFLQKVASPTDNIFMTVEGDSSGPDGTPITNGTSNDVVGSGLTTGYVETTFTFGSAFTLAANTTYWIVLQRDSTLDNTNYYQIECDSDGDWGNYDCQDYNGSAWADNADLAYFEVVAASGYDGYSYYKAAGDEYKRMNWVGFIKETLSAGDDAELVYTGVLPGYTGLTQGADYYVQDTDGTIGATVGTYTNKVGRAISSTELLIEKSSVPQYLESIGDSGDTISYDQDSIAKLAYVQMDWSNANTSAGGSGQVTIYSTGVTSGYEMDRAGASDITTANATWDAGNDKITLTYSGASSTSVTGTAKFYW